jgi:hypothetical protein
MHQHALSQESVRSEAERKETLRALRAEKLHCDIHKFTCHWRSVYALEALARPNYGREAYDVAHVIKQTNGTPQEVSQVSRVSSRSTREDVSWASLSRAERVARNNLDWETVIDKEID